jgi:hypothetical protein
MAAVVRLKNVSLGGDRMFREEEPSGMWYPMRKWVEGMKGKKYERRGGKMGAPGASERFFDNELTSILFKLQVGQT